MKRKIIFALLILAVIQVSGQNKGVLTGDVEIFQNFYFLDSAILSDPIPPQYYQQLSSTDAWINLNYRTDKDLTLGIRFDLFNNSGLRNPYIVNNGQGIGFWFAKKKIDKLEVTIGSFYDQFGSGITFRAYEARGQNLDYAIEGLHLKYAINENWTAKAFTGKQKFLFSRYAPIVKGFNLDGSLQATPKILLNPGGSIVNRTLDNNTIDLIVNGLNTYPLEQRFTPKYNVYLGSIYNTLLVGNWTWYVEAALKSRETVADRLGRFSNEKGHVLFTYLTYAQPGLGLTLQYKRTSQFEFRTSPLEILNDGLINFIPPSARLNTGRLTGRYAPATQLIGEEGLQADATFKIKKKHQLQLNAATVNDLTGKPLYRELYAEGKFKLDAENTVTFGIQSQTYNQEIYEFKPGASLVRTLTPFMEWVKKIDRKRSLRTEISHMATQQDLGSWFYFLTEFNVAPKYSISISDMYNYGNKNRKDRIHYYALMGVYIQGRTRFSGGYVRQVEGINCAGGICRIEPAFNGLRFTLNTTF